MMGASRNGHLADSGGDFPCEQGLVFHGLLNENASLDSRSKS